MVKTNIKPLFDNILIRPLEAEAKTASGIILPDTAQEKPQMGKIVAVGPGKVTPKGEKEKIVVKVGQKVMYKKWGGNEVKLNGEELILVEQKDILAIIEEAESPFETARKLLRETGQNQK
jgi:chaperonin GroES